MKMIASLRNYIRPFSWVAAILYAASGVALAGPVTDASYARVRRVAVENGMTCMRKGRTVGFALPANVINPRDKKYRARWRQFALLMKSKLGDDAVVVILDHKGHRLADSL